MSKQVDGPIDPTTEGRIAETMARQLEAKVAQMLGLPPEIVQPPALTTAGLARDTFRVAGIYVDGHGLAKPGEAVIVHGGDLLGDITLIHPDDAWGVWKRMYGKAEGKEAGDA